MQRSVTFWVCAILGEEKDDELPRQSPRHNVLTCLVPSSMGCWRSHGHRCLPSNDATQMMPPPTFIERSRRPDVPSGQPGGGTAAGTTKVRSAWKRGTPQPDPPGGIVARPPAWPGSFDRGELGGVEQLETRPTRVADPCAGQRAGGAGCGHGALLAGKDGPIFAIPPAPQESPRPLNYIIKKYNKNIFFKSFQGLRRSDEIE
jgi:hypothetical protein